MHSLLLPSPFPPSISRPPHFSLVPPVDFSAYIPQGGERQPSGVGWGYFC
jgi:hypothetical protein